MSLTIYDVAKEAGYSHTAVSATLNGRGDKAGIGRAAQKRIIEVANRLGYRRNALATALFGGQNRVLGVLISQPDKQWVGEVLRGAFELARERDYLLKIVAVADTENLAEASLDAFLEQRISGVFLVDFDPTYQLAEHIRDDAARRRLRILSCNSDLDIPGRHLNPDDEDGTRQAVHHLVELGHTRIGYIGPEPIGQGRETVRWRGYRHTMEEYGFEPSDEMIHFSGWVPSQGESIKPAWLADGAKRMPTAVLCANDQIAARVIRQARRNGLTVPTDLSVIGFSNELLGNYIDPQLTTIHQSYPELGRRALELLIEEVETNALDGTPKRQTKKSRAKDQVLMPVELVERETTAKPRKR